MTVHIDPTGGVLLVVACFVGYFVYKHTTRQEAVGKGDIVGAIVAGTSVLTALMLILGGTHPTPPASAPDEPGAPSASTSPPGPAAGGR